MPGLHQVPLQRAGTAGGDRTVVGALDGDGDRLIRTRRGRGGRIVSHADDVGQDQCFTGSQIIERFSPGVEAPVE